MPGSRSCPAHPLVPKWQPNFRFIGVAIQEINSCYCFNWHNQYSSSAIFRSSFFIESNNIRHLSHIIARLKETDHRTPISFFFSLSPSLQSVSESHFVGKPGLLAIHKYISRVLLSPSKWLRRQQISQRSSLMLKHKGLTMRYVHVLSSLEFAPGNLKTSH